MRAQNAGTVSLPDAAERGIIAIRGGLSRQPVFPTAVLVCDVGIQFGVYRCRAPSARKQAMVILRTAVGPPRQGSFWSPYSTPVGLIRRRRNSGQVVPKKSRNTIQRNLSRIPI